MPDAEQEAGTTGAGGYHTRPATEADVPALAAVYSAAFEPNPAYRFVFSGDPDVPAPPGALRWLFERRISLLLMCRCPVLVLCDGPDPAAATILAAGGLVPLDRKPGMSHMVRAGILTWPLYWGAASMKRALQMDTELKALTQPGGSMAGLGVGGELVLMAVAPGAQGKGLGQRLLSALLRHWDAEFGGSGGLLLTTQLPSALHIYKKAGFQPIALGGKEDRQHAQGGFGYWLMHRPAAGAAADDGNGASSEEGS